MSGSEPVKDLEAVLVEACRFIEKRMADRGHKFAAHFDDNMVAGARASMPPGPMHFTCTWYGKLLGKVAVKSRARWLKAGPGTRVLAPPKAPSVVDDIKDAVEEMQGGERAGLRAGMKELLQKYRQALENIVALAEGRPSEPAIQQMTSAAAMLRPDDPVVRALTAVVQLRTECDDAENRAEAADLEEDPEEQLRQRLRLKVKARYVTQREILVEFCKHMVLRAWEFKNKADDGTVTDGTAEKVVDDFLEHAGEKDAEGRADR
jgi:hypothetical protein